MKRRFLAIACMLTLIVGLSSCGNNESQKTSKNEKTPVETNNEEKKDIIVFAAASLTESLTELKDMYERENPDVNITYNFDSSGTLKTQIEEGATCDVFISASNKPMDELEESDKGESLISPDSRIDLLENELVLAVREDSDKDINSFEDLKSDKAESIALGNSDVPAGDYAKKLLTNLGIWNEVSNKASFASNVKEVTSWISESAVDCGIIYSTDAKAEELKVVDRASKDQLKEDIVYPAALVEKSNEKEEGKKFLEYLNSDQASKVFKDYGFKKD
ncbi:molybdate ABC transporter substrate-binding protein [uncultured Anaerococcus sp.]|uniref:molybdate ABC transporter substrate-binding protein n=1 Tax=uncultured Anaerococcus sp. TaxID=293428 RepID=UPI002630871A|nr:molybdate ABC transporter substrate-binding protein [uncultured Anaerococcus sp.]